MIGVLPGSQKELVLASIKIARVKSGRLILDRENPMSYVTEAELVEIVPNLRAMASVETSAEVRAALNRLADRYAAMAVGCQDNVALTAACEFAV